MGYEHHRMRAKSLLNCSKSALKGMQHTYMGICPVPSKLGILKPIYLEHFEHKMIINDVRAKSWQAACMKHVDMFGA